ncbi:type II secretion system major pseudopilin GspG [Asaia lannensis]|uniref:Type II secretion system core protein G n=1 Tax=Asaia lannensis NBRC 102526 TaxID=1307926 RepID=A0ABT1CI90_9PROT|nr:type II secretion system major pseudopilin GspG [Asaia lannensis]MCO6160575.1 type II secretion system major pseudopilin GspG [Asaia lannensis NBRC 102526]GBQ95311.1 general secretion protein G [Asaia lannensis NBRC 102526]
MSETSLLRILRLCTSPPHNRDDRCQSDTQESGFTLLELLVVIAILGLLIGLVAPAALRQLGGARNSVAHQSIQRLGEVLDLYKLDVGAYPSTEDGLHALIERPQEAESWNGPYLKDGAEPKDPWHHPYLYASPSERPGHDYDLCSRGAHNTTDRAAMICNP